MLHSTASPESPLYAFSGLGASARLHVGLVRLERGEFLSVKSTSGLVGVSGNWLIRRLDCFLVKMWALRLSPVIIMCLKT